MSFVVLIKVTGKIFLDPIFMPPTLKKLKHIALGLSVCAHPSVIVRVTIPKKKSSKDFEFAKDENEILQSRYLKNYYG